jgi:CRP-like cAMP-binding protein
MINELKNINFVSQIPKPLLESLIPHMTLLKYQKNQIIYDSKELKTQKEVFSYILLDGSFRVSCDSDIGNIYNLVYSSPCVGYEMIGDLDPSSNYKFSEIQYSFIYSTEDESYIIKVDKKPCHKIIKQYLDLNQNKLLKDFIKQVVPGFDALNQNTISRLSNYFLEKNYPAGTTIVCEGSIQEYVYLIASGKVQLSIKKKLKSQKELEHGNEEISLNQKSLNSNRIAKEQPNLQKINICVYESKKWLNEDCIIKNTKSLFTITALTNTVLFAVKKDNFINKILPLSPDTANFFEKSSETKLQILKERIENFRLNYLNASACKKNFIVTKRIKNNIELIKTGFPKSVKEFFTEREIFSYDSDIGRKNKFLPTREKIESEEKKSLKLNSFYQKLETVNLLNNKINLNLMENCTSREISLKRMNLKNASAMKKRNLFHPFKTQLEFEVLDDKKLMSNMNRPQTSRKRIQSATMSMYSQILEDQYKNQSSINKIQNKGRNASNKLSNRNLCGSSTDNFTSTISSSVKFPSKLKINSITLRNGDSIILGTQSSTINVNLAGSSKKINTKLSSKLTKKFNFKKLNTGVSKMSI